MTCKQCKYITACMAEADGLGQVFDPNYDGEHGCTDFVPFTNAQKIRAMSDEELAGLIRVIYMSEECPLGTLACETCFFKEVCAGEYCGKEVEWLKQPSE